MRTNVERLMYLCSRSSNSTEISKDWVKAHLGKDLCPECRGVMPGTGPVDVEVFYLEKTLPLTSDGTTAIGFMSVDMLEPFRKKGYDKYLQPGKVFYKGKLNEKYVTFNCTHRVIIRNEDDGKSGRSCKTCGTIFYSGYGDHFVSRAALKSKPPVTGFFFSSLLVELEFGRKLRDMKKWRAVAFEEIPVYDEPKDLWGHPEY